MQINQTSVLAQLAVNLTGKQLQEAEIADPTALPVKQTHKLSTKVAEASIKDVHARPLPKAEAVTEAKAEKILPVSGGLFKLPPPHVIRMDENGCIYCGFEEQGPKPATLTSTEVIKVEAEVTIGGQIPEEITIGQLSPFKPGVAVSPVGSKLFHKADMLHGELSEIVNMLQKLSEHTDVPKGVLGRLEHIEGLVADFAEFKSLNFETRSERFSYIQISAKIETASHSIDKIGAVLEDYIQKFRADMQEKKMEQIGIGKRLNWVSNQLSEFSVKFTKFTSVMVRVNEHHGLKPLEAVALKPVELPGIKLANQAEKLGEQLSGVMEFAKHVSQRIDLPNSVFSELGNISNYLEIFQKNASLLHTINADKEPYAEISEKLTASAETLDKIQSIVKEAFAKYRASLPAQNLSEASVVDVNVVQEAEVASIFPQAKISDHVAWGKRLNALSNQLAGFDTSFTQFIENLGKINERYGIA